MENKALDNFFSLLSASLNGEVYEIPPDFDIEAIYSLSKKHSLSTAVYISLEPYISQINDNVLLKKWKTEKSEALFKQIQFDLEREAIAEYLSSIGCWYMMLKGIILKDLYINPAMREFADNDILFDEAFANQIKEFMVARGYDATVEKGKDDVYTKKPFYNFEMHRCLVDRAEGSLLFDYYSNIKSRLLADKNNPYELRFNDEDFYIHLVVHEFYHYSGSGTGLRALTDTYVYLKAKGDNLNWNYINTELKRLGIAEFEATLRALSLKLLSYPQKLTLTIAENDMLSYIVSSGTYGLRENYIKNDLRSQFGEQALTKKNKLKYFLKRIFISKDAIKSKYPIIKKHPFLLPFGYLYRIVIDGASDFKRIFNEIRFVWKK